MKSSSTYSKDTRIFFDKLSSSRLHYMQCTRFEQKLTED